MHIVIVNDFGYVNGGASQVALSSAIALAGKGHVVTLLAAVGPVMPELIRAKVRVVCLEQHEILTDPVRLRAAVQGIWNTRAGKRMGELLQTIDPAGAVVHVHGWTKALSSSVAREAIKRRFRIVCTLHDYFTACPNGGFFNYQTRSICHLSPMSWACVTSSCDARNYPQKLWRVVRQAVQQRVGLLPSGVSCFVAVSDFSAAILRRHLPRQASIRRIDNPVDITRKDLCEAETNEHFVFVGRLSPEKGPLLFADAARSSSARGVFVGDGECRAELLHLYPDAIVTGWVSREEVIRRLQTTRALVFPSLWYETLGLVVQEAAAIGVPSVIADTSAAREFVMDGVNGLWFRGGDADDLARKLLLLKDDALVRRLGRAAYEKYWGNPSTMDLHVSRLEHCYREVLTANDGMSQMA